ncbi:MAG: hypothetical protein Tsb0026_10790 [Sulfuricaulis sp.]
MHFSEDIPILEDWECFSLLARKGQAAYMDCETAIQYGHTGPRITNASQLQRVTSHLVVLSRVYGADNGFMAQHGQAYQEIVDELRYKRIHALLRNHDIVTARKEIQSMEKCSWRYRVAVFLPVPLLDIFLDISSLLAG